MKGREEAAAGNFGLEQTEIVGRRIDDFFLSARGETIPEAFAPGLHLSLLREIAEGAVG